MICLLKDKDVELTESVRRSLRSRAWVSLDNELVLAVQGPKQGLSSCNTKHHPEAGWVTIRANDHLWTQHSVPDHKAWDCPHSESRQVWL